jgi:hypothetical protein
MLGEIWGRGILRNLRRIPRTGSDWVHAEEVHGVDLLERSILGLDDKEVNNGSKTQTTATKDKAVEPVDLINDDGRKERDQEVQYPIRGSRKTHARRTVSSRIKLSNNGPDKRTPCGSKRDNEQAGKDD